MCTDYSDTSVARQVSYLNQTSRRVTREKKQYTEKKENDTE